MPNVRKDIIARNNNGRWSQHAYQDPTSGLAFYINGDTPDRWDWYDLNNNRVSMPGDAVSRWWGGDNFGIDKSPVQQTIDYVSLMRGNSPSPDRIGMGSGTAPAVQPMPGMGAMPQETPIVAPGVNAQNVSNQPVQQPVRMDYPMSPVQTPPQIRQQTPNEEELKRRSPGQRTAKYVGGIGGF